MTFIQKLKQIQLKNNSLLCIGLDTEISKIPQSIRHCENPELEFNRRIIDGTKDLVCAYKLNLAFYESMGERGRYTLRQTIAHIPGEIVTIGDGKRGDISNTAEQYAKSLFEDLKFSASTVNPYMGKDSIEPFIKQAERCAFVLAVTSNKGSKDFQYLKVRGKPLYEHVVNAAKKWNTKKNIGLVVGATRPAELKRVRSLVSDMPILIPGIGAQGGDIESTVRYGCNTRGELALINIGRSIIYASNGENFAEKARETALTMRDKINNYREKYFG